MSDKLDIFQEMEAVIHQVNPHKQTLLDFLEQLKKEWARMAEAWYKQTDTVTKLTHTIEKYEAQILKLTEKKEK